MVWTYDTYFIESITLPYTMFTPGATYAATLEFHCGNLGDPNAIVVGSGGMKTFTIPAVTQAGFSINPSPVCLGDPVVITNLAILPAGIDYSIDGGPFFSNNNPSFSYVFTTPGVHTITQQVFPFGYIGAAGQCFEELTQTVLVEEAEALFTATDACVGRPVTFTDLSTCATSWLWTFGDGTTSTQQNPQHAYTAPGTYTVTLYINGSTSLSYMQTVTIHPLPFPTLSGPTDLCDGTNFVYTVSNLPAGSTFVWSVSGGTPLGGPGPNSITVTWGPSGGFVKVVVTSDKGCENSAILYVEPCCEVPGAIEITNGMTASGLITSQGTNTFNGQLFSINGTFTVNSNLTFNGCEVVLGPNARVDIQNGKELRFTTSHLHGCGVKMWDGLYVAGSTALLFMNKCDVEDALNAIVSDATGRFEILGCTFDRNWKGIQVNSTTIPHPGIVNSSEFFCANPANMLQPHVNERSKYGIQLDRVAALTIGAGNTFDNQLVGIYAENSNLTVADNVFRNMPALMQGGQPVSGTGIGIRALNTAPLSSFNSIEIRKGANNLGNDFLSCHLGVDVGGGMNTVITDNRFSTMTFEAVRVTQGFKRNIRIARNTIGNATTGIHTIQNTGADLFIHDNAIVYAGLSPGWGIIVSDINAYTPGKTTNAQIYSNSILLNGSAITALGIRKAVIRNNNIRMSVPSAAYPNINVYGIRAFGSPEVEIDDNSMESLTQTDMRVRGIWVENSPEAFVKCNDIHRYAQHLTFSGSCPNTEMWQNTLDRGRRGLVLTNQGLIGQQGAPGHPIDNKWIGTFGQAEAWTELNSNLLPSQNRLYIKQAGVNSIFFPSPNLDDPTPSLPFLLSTTTGASIQCPVSPVRLAQKDNLEKIALDSIAFASLPDESKFLAKQHLHQKLMTDPSLTASSQVLQNCLPGLCLTGVGKAAEVETEIGQDDYLESWMKNELLNLNGPVEGKHQELNRIYLEHFAAWANALDSVDLSQLLTLAHECPYEGGQAVYQARTLVELVQPGEQYDDNCMQTLTGSGNRTAAPVNIEKIVELEFSIFPNPSEGSFAVMGTLQKNGVVQLLDIHGRVVKEARLESGDFNATFHLDTHADGIYLVRIVDQVGVVWTSKLVLQRK